MGTSVGATNDPQQFRIVTVQKGSALWRWVQQRLEWPRFRRAYTADTCRLFDLLPELPPKEWRR